MRRIHTTFDLLEAHIVATMLREHDIEAWPFDVDMVRQDWFKMIAFGGFRILVPEQSVAAARDLINGYLHGDLALDNVHADTCPMCGAASVTADPQPRRNVFIAMILSGPVELLVMANFPTTDLSLMIGLSSLFVASISLPWFIVRYFKWRWRCNSCGARWRTKPLHRYADLARMAQAGDSAVS